MRYLSLLFNERPVRVHRMRAVGEALIVQCKSTSDPSTELTSALGAVTTGATDKKGNEWNR